MSIILSTRSQFMYFEYSEIFYACHVPENVSIECG